MRIERWRCGAREDGAVALVTMLLTALLVLSLGAVFFVQYAKAEDEAGSIQNAADAAALAGAQSVAKDSLGALVSAIRNGHGLQCGLGQEAASDFATRNDTTLVSYCYSPSQDRIEVTVRSNYVTESGRREERKSRSRLGKELGPCKIPDRPTQPTTPTTTTTTTPDPDDPPPTPTTPPPPPDVDDTITCGDIDFDITWPGDGGDFVIHPWSPSDWRNLFDPALD